MSFVLLYTLILLVPLTLAVALRYLIVVPRRRCIQCDRQVAVTTIRCRHCGYVYTFEDRQIMKLLAEARQRESRASQGADPR